VDLLEQVDLIDHNGSGDMPDNTCPQKQADAGSSRTASASTGKPVKRKRLSARDLQMGSAVSENRLTAVKTSADLKEASNMKVMAIALAKKEELVRRQEKLQQGIADKHIASAILDREVQKDAVSVQKAALADQKRHNVEKLKSEEIIELMRLYVSAGKDPAEARRLARQEVLGYAV
jgi:hypothetical protein